MTAAISISKPCHQTGFYFITIDKPLPEITNSESTFQVITEYSIIYSLYNRKRKIIASIESTSPFQAWKKFKELHERKVYWKYLNVVKIV